LLPPVRDALLRVVRGAPGGVLTAGAVVIGMALSVLAVYLVSPSSSDDEVGTVVRVGVSEGDSLPAYVAHTRAVLAALPDGAERYALVSFTAYLAPDRLTPVLAPVGVSSVFTHVSLPRTQTELLRLGAYQIPQDVVAAMDLTAQNKDAEAANFTRMQRLAQGHDDARAQVYAAGALITSEEATAYRQHCSCVYAAVVRGTPGSLRSLVGRGEVRAVDLVPAPTRLDRTVFLPPLPEENGTVWPAEDSSVPTPSTLRTASSR